MVNAQHSRGLWFGGGQTIPLLPVCDETKRYRCTQDWGGEQSPYSPAERPEPGQVVRVVHVIANSDNLVETFDLDTHHLHKKTCGSCKACWLNISFLKKKKNMQGQSKRYFSSYYQSGRSLLIQHGKLTMLFFPPLSSPGF